MTLRSQTTATLGTLRGGTGAERSYANGGAERSEAVREWSVMPLTMLFQLEYNGGIGPKGEVGAFVGSCAEKCDRLGHII